MKKTVKTIIKKVPIKITKKAPLKKKVKYFETIGKRKTAVARVRMWDGKGKDFLVNKKPFKDYFQSIELQQVVLIPLVKLDCEDKFRFEVIVHGGGIQAQAGAIRHGISKALINFDSTTFRARLKKAGFLTRDSRKRERKKFGLKRARRAPQWRKR